ncbi:hypothetical protein DFH07DRAFT_729548, partial [Mycena maculata]
YAYGWWKWWAAMQPEEREMIDGMLTCPAEADWSHLSTLHGKDGLVKVVRSVFWWGKYVHEELTDPLDTLAWEDAVQDVSYVLTELTQPAVLK